MGQENSPKYTGPNNHNIGSMIYEARVEELLLSNLARTNPNSSILQPSQDIGAQTIEFLPEKIQDQPGWDSIGVIAHPQDYYTEAEPGEQLMTIQLCQGLSEHLEFMAKYTILLWQGIHRVKRVNCLLDYANNKDCRLEFEYVSCVDISEVTELSRLLAAAPVRPAGC